MKSVACTLARACLDLAELAGGLGEQGNADEQRDIDRQAPEQGMHERVEFGKPEQGVGPQPEPAEQAVLDDIRREKEGAFEAWKE